MSEKMTVPAFTSEAEEAQWWFDNQERFADDLFRAFDNGTAGRGTVMKRALAMQDGITPEPEDIQQARTLAEKKGIPYHDLLKQIIHEGLQREQAAQPHAEAA